MTMAAKAKVLHLGAQARCRALFRTYMTCRAAGEASSMQGGCSKRKLEGYQCLNLSI